MADLIDRANELAEDMLQAALSRQQRPACAPAALWCDDCGEQIPELRRLAAMGCACCISCQELRELRNR